MFMCTFKRKNMSISHCCTTPNIEETMNNKDLILNATSQNDAIKVRLKRFTKNIHEFWKLTFINEKVCPCNAPSLCLPPFQLVQSKHSKRNISRHKNKFSSYYSIKLLKYHIDIDNKPCSSAFINASNGSHIWASKAIMKTCYVWYCWHPMKVVDQCGQHMVSIIGQQDGNSPSMWHYDDFFKSFGSNARCSYFWFSCSEKRQW